MPLQERGNQVLPAQRAKARVLRRPGRRVKGRIRSPRRKRGQQKQQQQKQGKPAAPETGLHGLLPPNAQEYLYYTDVSSKWKSENKKKNPSSTCH